MRTRSGTSTSLTNDRPLEALITPSAVRGTAAGEVRRYRGSDGAETEERDPVGQDSPSAGIEGLRGGE